MSMSMVVIQFVMKTSSFEKITESKKIFFIFQENFMENHQSSVKVKTMTSINLSTVTTDVISPTYDTSIITTINIGIPQ